MKILDKPPGVTTHTSLNPDEQKRLWIDPVDGFIEHLQHRSSIALWPVHRLDVGTSGVCLVAESPDEASQLAQSFESRAFEKTYYFVSDRKPRRGFVSGGKIESHITRMKTGGSKATQYASFSPTAQEPINAVTVIEHVRDHGSFSLWRAKPETGKPHQIRLHAESVGLSILGDEEHGGTKFPSLCLHAAEIKNESILASSPLPRWFENLDLLSRPQLIAWLQAFERRERLYRSLQVVGVLRPETLRWIHTDGGPLRMDQLGDIYQLHWYAEKLGATDQADIDLLTQNLRLHSWYVQVRGNRGREPNKENMQLSAPTLPERWLANEEAFRFIFRRDSGLSPGLFLDQRANRRMLHLLKPRAVLNLFSYTGGFSVAAAKAGAERVVTVDISRKFLEWAKENFRANSLDPENKNFEFRDIDSQIYLKWAAKNSLLFDAVICDPPSFARLEKSVFRLETELETLISQCLDVTAPGGFTLFSTNHEGLTSEQIVKRIDALLRATKRPFRIERAPSPDWDFEFPREPRLMKSLVLRRAYS